MNIKLDLDNISAGVSSAVWRILSATIPRDRNSIAVCTFPDFDDTIRALQIAAAELGVFLDILLNHESSVRPSWLDLSICRVYYKSSAKGIVAFHRSSFAVFTHGLFSAMPLIEDRPTLNVWHGMPIKRIGKLDPNMSSKLPKSHWTIAENEFFRGIMADAFGMNRSQVLIMEHPRLDILAAPPHFQKWWPQPEDALIVWLPTYRQSSRGDIRNDGGASPITCENNMRALDALLLKHGGSVIVKLHAMDKLQPSSLPRYEKITFINDETLQEHGVSLYQFLGRADGLLTDISSVIFDFRKTGRPIWIYFPDHGAYDLSRGFVAKLDDLIMEPVALDFGFILDQLTQFLSGPHAPSKMVTLQTNRALDILKHMLVAKNRNI